MFVRKGFFQVTYKKFSQDLFHQEKPLKKDEVKITNENNKEMNEIKQGIEIMKEDFKKIQNNQKYMKRDLRELMISTYFFAFVIFMLLLNK